MVDTPLLNKEDAYVSKAEDGTGYILKKWFQGRECDVRRENELIAGAENLARIHLCMRLAGEENGFAGREENPVIKEYARHNRELRKVREFVCRRSVKSPFEIAFLKGYDQMYFGQTECWKYWKIWIWTVFLKKRGRKSYGPRRL